MSRWRVLITAPYAMPVLDRYRAELEPHDIEVVAATVHERLSEEELLPLVADVDGVICGDDQFSERVLSAAPRLRVLSKWGTGIDSIDREAAARRGVRVCNTPNAFSEPVADTVYAYMLSFARRVPSSDREMKAGQWRKAQLVSLGECVLGIVGIGDCGKAVVRRAGGFGLTVLGTDVVEPPADFVTTTGIEMVSLDELLRRADFVTLHTDLNPTSRHLIGREQLRLMKPTAYLINTSRGPIVDQEALVQALQATVIAGAALDVFEDEPLPTGSPLLSMDNVLLSPHTANSSPAAAERVHEHTIANLLHALEDGVPAAGNA